MSALSTGYIIVSRISEVASPDPATMPRIAQIRSEMATPTLMTLGSLYIAIASRMSLKGVSKSLGFADKDPIRDSLKGFD